jgi:hypothetical protein
MSPLDWNNGDHTAYLYDLISGDCLPDYSLVRDSVATDHMDSMKNIFPFPVQISLER